MSWVTPDFRALNPSYENSNKPPSRDDLRQLGCREQTIAYLFPNPATEAILREPVDWFFTDRGWWRAPAPVLEDVYRIAGGCFGDLSLQEQTVLLDIPLQTIEGIRLKGGRGKWEGRNGSAVSVEEFALQRLSESGETGTACEGKGFFLLHMIVKKRFEAMYGHWAGWEPGNRIKFIPSEQYAEKVLAALDYVLRDPIREFKQHERYYKAVFDFPIDLVLLFIQTTSRPYIRRFLHHSYKHGIMGFSGHPDLTIGSDGARLRFVEVKAADRLHSNQAFWIRDFAKPLGLDVRVVRVEPPHKN